MEQQRKLVWKMNYVLLGLYRHQLLKKKIIELENKVRKRTSVGGEYEYFNVIFIFMNILCNISLNIFSNGMTMLM